MAVGSAVAAVSGAARIARKKGGSLLGISTSALDAMVETRQFKSKTAFFFEKLRAACIAEMDKALRTTTYDFHRRQIGDQRAFREALAGIFAEMRDASR